MATVALQSSEGKWIMVATILASSMAFIDGSVLNVVLPALQRNLQATGTDLFWILNAYLLMLASLMLIGGSLGDKLGRKKVFMAGIFTFMVGSAACGLSSGVTLLIIFRMVQGIGGALMIPGSLSLISSAINPEERGKAIGTWSAVTTIVTVGGPVLGGALADAGLWRYIFFINVPLGVVTLWALWKKVNEIRDGDAGAVLDFPGAIAITLGLALVTFGFLRMPAVGFNNWQVYGSLITGVAVLALFIWIEKKSSNPMMPLHLFSSLTFTGANLLAFFLYASMGAGILFLSLNLVQVQGYSQLQSGLTFLPMTALMISLARLAGGLADKYGPRLFLIFGPTTAGLGMLLLSFVTQTSGPGAYGTTFFPGIFVFGLGMTFTVAPLTAAAMGSVSDHFSGAASGINNAVTRIANVFANAIFGALAVVIFTGTLQHQVQTTALTTPDRQAVMTQAANLGDAKVPEQIAESDKAVIEKAYHLSFIDAYVVIMRISAALGLAAGLMAFIFVRNSEIKKEK